jgi:hypothetical protein
LSLNIYLLGLLLVTLHKGCSSLLFRCFGNLASNHSRPHSSTLSCIPSVEGFRISWRRSRFLCFRSPRSCVRRRFFADPVSSCRSLQILPCRARIWCLAKLPNVFWHTSHAVLQTSSGLIIICSRLYSADFCADQFLRGCCASSVSTRSCIARRRDCRPSFWLRRQRNSACNSACWPPPSTVVALPSAASTPGAPARATTRRESRQIHALSHVR